MRHCEILCKFSRHVAEHVFVGQVPRLGCIRHGLASDRPQLGHSALVDRHEAGVFAAPLLFSQSRCAVPSPSCVCVAVLRRSPYRLNALGAALVSASKLGFAVPKESMTGPASGFNVIPRLGPKVVLGEPLAPRSS